MLVQTIIPFIKYSFADIIRHLLAASEWNKILKGDFTVIMIIVIKLLYNTVNDLDLLNNFCIQKGVVSKWFVTTVKFYGTWKKSNINLLSESHYICIYLSTEIELEFLNKCAYNLATSLYMVLKLRKRKNIEFWSNIQTQIQYFLPQKITNTKVSFNGLLSQDKK